jgi:hypothetical protein
MAGVDPLESAGPTVELGELAGDEALAAELGGDGLSWPTGSMTARWAISPLRA